GGADARTGFSFDIGRRSRAVAETAKFTLSPVPGAGSRPAWPCYAVRRGLGQLPAMDYIAVMVPDSSLPRAQGIVREVEATLSEARLAIQDIDDLPDDPLVMPC